MNILALETSGVHCSVALLTPDDEIVELIDDSSLSHSSKLLAMVENTLQQAGLEAGQLDCIAVTRGPGSFTGLRIGIAVAQGLAFGYGLPVVAVSSLAMVASAAARQLNKLLQADSTGATGDKPLPVSNVLATLDARMQEIYCANYRLGDGEPELQGNERVLPPGAIGELFIGNPHSIAALSPGDYLLAGPGLVYASEMPQKLVKQAYSLPGVDNKELPNAMATIVPGAGDLLRLARTLCDRQQWEQPAQLTPTYLRNKVTD